MSETRVRLRNRRRQPVELHLPDGVVVVLPPEGEVEVAASVLATPQVSWLLARRVLDAESVSEAATGASGPAEAAGRRAGKRGGAAGAGKRRRAPKP